jgi:alpha/beta superfamily hydrolase
MPRPSEFLERMTVVQSAGESMEALFHRGRGAQPIVLAPGHPRLYGTMESAVLAEVTWALTRRGHATLRFNWRGVGASTGASDIPDLFERRPDDGPLDPQRLDAAYEDLSAAIEQHADSTGERTIGVVGYSFGAAVAARAAIEHEAVDRVVLIAPPVGRLPFDFAAMASSGVLVFVACGDADRLAPIDDVERAVGGHVGVTRIEHAGHEFARGLGPLGSFVVNAFPQTHDAIF